MNGNKITIYNAVIGVKSYRNFSGTVNENNTSGARYFTIFLDPDFAREIEAQGAPVVWKPNKFNNNELRPQMKVHVKYHDRTGRALIPPKVVEITSKGQTNLDESTIGTLDSADIQKADMILSMYKNKGTIGPENCVALKTLYVTLDEDELEALYSRSEPTYEETPW